MARGFKAAGILAARACGEKKGGSITLIHAGTASPMADYLLLVTALSPIHLETLEYEVIKTLKADAIPCIHRSRPQSPRWRALDFGGLIVHLMTEQAREFYSLEKLYPDSPRVRLSANGSAASGKTRKSPRRKTRAGTH